MHGKKIWYSPYPGAETVTSFNTRAARQTRLYALSETLPDHEAHQTKQKLQQAQRRQAGTYEVASKQTWPDNDPI